MMIPDPGPRRAAGSAAGRPGSGSSPDPVGPMAAPPRAFGPHPPAGNTGGGRWAAAAPPPPGSRAPGPPRCGASRYGPPPPPWLFDSSSQRQAPSPWPPLGGGAGGRGGRHLELRGGGHRLLPCQSPCQPSEGPDLLLHRRKPFEGLLQATVSYSCSLGAARVVDDA